MNKVNFNPRIYPLFFSVFFITTLITSAQNTKPNIIVFISDDQSQIDMGSYGNKDVHTPNMDRLASQGMRFTSAYAASPMCAPSRSNMLTGLYPFRNGSQMNHFALRPGIKTLPDYMKKLGYEVVIAGKIDVFPEPAFDKHIGKYFGKYQPVENRSDPKNVTTDFIKNYFSEKSGKPLCLIVATWLPHVPWEENKEFKLQDLKLPEYLVDTPKTRKALAAYYHSISRADKMLGEVLQAVDENTKKDNTVFMFFSDQGTQFPGAKWTTYDQGLRVPFLVRWPGKIKAESVSDAMISLTDLTPTLIDLAGGEPVKGLDGKSFKDVILGNQEEHREYIFAETSLEPQYWYNYAPSRTIFGKNGFHYIRNYHPGVRFITHIDKVEQNMFYFDSWVQKAKDDKKADFLLNRYSYRPPEELYNLKKDPWELNNLLNNNLNYKKQKAKLADILDQNLADQSETESMILQGNLPTFYDHSYHIKQGISVHQLSFDKTLWNPDKCIITAYLKGIHKDGVICEYFNQFNILVNENKIGVEFDKDKFFFSEPLTDNSGELILKLDNEGKLLVEYNGKEIISEKINADRTKINSGYISCGLSREKELAPDQTNIFEGEIFDLRVTMDNLVRVPRL